MAPNFDQLAADLRQKLIFDRRNLYDPERLAELGWTYVAIGLGTDARRRRLAGKPVKARRPLAEVQKCYLVIGARSGSLR